MTRQSREEEECGAGSLYVKIADHLECPMIKQQTRWRKPQKSSQIALARAEHLTQLPSS